MKSSLFNIRIIRPIVSGRKHKAIAERRRRLFPDAMYEQLKRMLSEHGEFHLFDHNNRKPSEFMDDLLEGRLEEKEA